MDNIYTYIFIFISSKHNIKENLQLILILKNKFLDIPSSSIYIYTAEIPDL